MGRDTRAQDHLNHVGNHHDQGQRSVPAKLGQWACMERPGPTISYTRRGEVMEKLARHFAQREA